MQLQTFKVFYDLVGTGSFSQAADLNGITQSAVSQQIKAVEETFGIKLLDRGRKRIVLTPEGQAFLETSRQILEVLEELSDRIRQMQDLVEGDLNIAAVLSIGLHELPPYLKIFRRKFPKVNVRVEYKRSAQVYAAVLENQADLGLVAYPAPRRGLQVQTFWKDRLVCICPPTHRLAHRKKVRFNHLDGERFIGFESDLPTRKMIDKHLKEAGVRVRHLMDFHNVETVKRTVEIENAISIVPEISVRTEVVDGRLVAIPISSSEMWRPLGVISKRNAVLCRAARVFLELLEQFDLGEEKKSHVPLQRKPQRQ